MSDTRSMAQYPGSHAEMMRYQGVAQEKATQLSAMEGRLILLRGRIAEFSGQLTSSLDRVLGSQPSDLPPMGPQPVANGMVEQINQQIDALDGIVRILGAQVDRLSDLA